MSETIYQMVTDKIVNLLERGTVPWRRTWVGGPSFELPVNLKTGHQYRGVNVILLVSAGYSSRFWLSFKQAQTLGGHVRRGERGWPVIFWKRIEITDSKTGGPKEIPMLRFYRIFNVDQCEGIAGPDVPEPVLNEFTPVQKAEAIIAGMPNPPAIVHHEPRPYYRASTDTVNLPLPELFDSSQFYYAAGFHELAHSTGHESRLNRRPSTAPRFFGDREYSKEELISEMASAFLCAEAKIEQATLEDTASYLSSWISVLKGTPKMAIKAASAAQAAADYILNNQNSQEVRNEES